MTGICFPWVVKTGKNSAFHGSKNLYEELISLKDKATQENIYIKFSILPEGHTMNIWS
jgi:hypothetical protein